MAVVVGDGGGKLRLLSCWIIKAACMVLSLLTGVIGAASGTLLLLRLLLAAAVAAGGDVAAGAMVRPVAGNDETRRR
jgi:hypothetical protein